MPEEETVETAPEPEAPEAEAPVEPAPEEEAPAEEQAPDVSEQLAALRSDMDGIKGRLPEEPAPPEGVYEQLTQGIGDDDSEEEYGDPYAPEEMDEEQQLRSLFREEAQALVMPFIREQKLNGFAEKHPDIREAEVLNDVVARLHRFVPQYGEDALTNPDLVELAYMAHKAEAAAAAETPAEAGGRRATLETDAGPGVPDTGKSPEEKFKEQVYGGATGNSVFG